MSKGSTPRPCNIEQFRKNFDTIKGWQTPRMATIKKALGNVKKRTQEKNSDRPTLHQ